MNSRRLTASLTVAAAPVAAVALALSAAGQWRMLGGDATAHGAVMADPTQFSSWAALAITSAGALCGGWLSAVTVPLLLMEHGRLGGREARTAARSAPRLWRGIVATAVGLGGAIGATGGAAYDENAIEDAPAWGASTTIPQVAETASAPADEASAGTRGAAQPQPDDTGHGAAADRHRVRPGDSLWRIAASRLPHGTSDAEITACWRAIYRENRDIIGADPGLIHPGQVLVIPRGLGS